jgi:hypothetical protein
VNVVYLTNDLLFSSRVISAARQAGVEVVMASSRADLAAKVKELSPRYLFIDVEHRDAQIEEIMAAAAACDPRPRVIAYGPHVHESLLLAAQKAGCDTVMSRGQFDRQYSALLMAAVNPPPHDQPQGSP